MATQYSVLNIYLRFARLWLKAGRKDKALECLKLALGECNRHAFMTIERKHVLRGMNATRRVV